MRVDESPFAAGWFGQGLGNVRPRCGTYGRYSYQSLPPLPFDLRGDFAWLRNQSLHKANIASEKAVENANVLTLVLQDAARHGSVIPPEFVEFFRSHNLQHRVRSCTDCFLDLSPIIVPSPVADGFLLRFLADSQGCIFWYLFQRPGGTEHCVVASPDFYGSEEEQWQDSPADPDQIIFCEESFERFLCRFWLENEIWYCNHEKRPLFAEAREYLEYYGRIA